MLMPTNVYVFVPPGGFYREIYSYGSIINNRFHPYLTMEIDPTEATSNKALAVVSGHIRVIRDPTLQDVCQLVIQPSPGEAPNISSVFGASSYLFVYHNLDVSTVRAIFEPIIASNILPHSIITPTQLTDIFMQEGFPVWVSGGQELGSASTRGGLQGWFRLAFEIVLIPNGIRVLQVGWQHDGWERIKSILEPDNISTRRLDPYSFYSRISPTASDGQLQFVPSHNNYNLLKILNRYINLELRNEYDNPFIGTVDITDNNTGITTSQTFEENNRGTIKLAINPADSKSYTLSKTNYIFTELPSGDSDTASPSMQLTAPGHWSLQLMFMADVDDSRNWFTNPTPPMARFSSRNKVTALIDGLPTFRRMVETMLDNETGGIRLVAWWIDDSFEMLPGVKLPNLNNTTFREITKKLSSEGKRVYLLAGDLLGFQNNDEVDRVNELDFGFAILDDEGSLNSSEHQKLMIVYSSNRDHNRAFLGGIDINPNRLDEPKHPITIKIDPYHDVHAEVQGEAVRDLNRTFLDRWNNHPEVTGGPLLPINDIEQYSPQATYHYVQVTRTYE